MATITAGTGATINAATIEGQLWQLIHLIQNGERTSAETERFSSNKDDTFTMTGSFTIPGALMYNSSTGLFTTAASPYLPALTFNPGSPLGTIKGTTLTQYFIDVCNYIITWQNNSAKNTQQLTNVTMSFNHNTQLYSGEFKLPYNTVISGSGGITETATEWLLT